MSTTLSIITPTKKSIEPINKNKHFNFIIHQAPTIHAIIRKSIFLTNSIENSKAIEWQKDIIEFLKPCGITVLNPQHNDWNSSLL